MESKEMLSQSNSSTFPAQIEELKAPCDDQVVAETEVETIQHTIDYLTGSRLYLLVIVCLLCIFLANFEITIVSTSLVSITNSLQDFGRSSWVVTSYLLSYTGFMVVTAKLSDTLGRKEMVIFSVLTFTIFSAGCGAAQTMNQLIILRAFQGLGASGVYSVVNTILFELVPPEKYPIYMLFVAADFAISYISGPLIGGLINQNTTWRWVFLLNVPAGACALIMLIIYMPNGFPYHLQNRKRRPIDIKKVDIIGACIMIVAITLLITAFEQVSNLVPWSSAQFLGPIIVSVLAWVAFLIYEKHITLRCLGRPEPVFPWDFCRSRVMIGLLINSILIGGVFTVCVIQIPLRFQAVNNETPWSAGVRLIPFGIATPVGGSFAAGICGKRRVPPIFMIFAGALLQVLGLIFMSRQTLDRILWTGQYGLQFLAGLGIGMTVTTTQIMVPYVIGKKEHLATATSALIQFRFLGAALFLAIVTAVMNSRLKHQLLLHSLSEAEFTRLLRTTDAIQALDEPLRTTVKEALLNGYNLQLQIVVGVAGAVFPATSLMWRQEQIRIA